MRNWLNKTDGKNDLSDVSAIASSVGEAVKRGTATIKNTADEKSKSWN